MLLVLKTFSTGQVARRETARWFPDILAPALRLEQSVSAPPNGRKAAGLTQESFENLLAFLGPTREEAGRRYEEIRRRLVKIFACRGCANPEELVDESIDRVARKAAELAPTYQGDPALYFYGVARLVYLESVKKKPFVAPPPEPDAGEENERELDCLDECMQALPPEQSALIREYYREDKSAKIEQRKSLAVRMGIEINALRIRAHRIRGELQKCVIACLERAEDG
jgi:DNA-directed RNA polymerase specialized sigma24 family protein